jgi:hypothetical protein
MLGDVYTILNKPVHKWVVVHEFENGKVNLREIGGVHRLFQVDPYNYNYIKQKPFLLTNKGNFERIYEIIGWKNLNLNSKIFDPLGDYRKYLQINSGVNFSQMSPFSMKIISPSEDVNYRIAMKLKEILNCEFIL